MAEDAQEEPIINETEHVNSQIGGEGPVQEVADEPVLIDSHPAAEETNVSELRPETANSGEGGNYSQEQAQEITSPELEVLQDSLEGEVDQSPTVDLFEFGANQNIVIEAQNDNEPAATENSIPPQSAAHEEIPQSAPQEEVRQSTVQESIRPSTAHDDIPQSPKVEIIIPPPKIAMIESDLRLWRNKPYLGGFRNKRTGIEYFNARTQTLTPQDIQAQNRKLANHRDTQTYDTANIKTQSNREKGTQMNKTGCHITLQGNYIIRSRKYITAEQDLATKNAKATIIQCFVRQVQARTKTRALRAAKKAKTKAFQEREKRRHHLLEKKRVSDNERRLHPKTDKDFEVLYSGLEHWRLKETNRINKLKLIEPARLAALADLLDQESALLQKIDKLKIDANVENRERSIINLLERVSAPKKWLCATDIMVHVDTPNIIRARELRDLYHALNFPILTVDERLQILLHVKFTAKEFDCNLTREIVDLIDREGDLISRGRSETSLEGLRKRISGLFLQFIQTPEFNPEMAAHIKLFKTDHQPWKEAAVYYCRGCTKYKSSTDFYLSTTLKHLGKCKDCSMKENLAIQKMDDSSYGSMLSMVRNQEASKRRSDKASDGTAFNAMALLQESDLRYLVDVVWNRKSAISGVRNIEDLTLTRWDARQELSPWNCILLTKTEAATHDCQVNPDAIYSIDFRNKIFQKQIISRQHFGQLPAMAAYLKENYQENKDGKLVSIQ